MKDEYIILNKTAIQKRIEESNKALKNPEFRYKEDAIIAERNALERILRQSTPLIPELEKVYDVGRSSFNSALSYEECKEDYYDYISNLKLDI